MSILLYMDHHVNRSIAEGLRRRGVDVLTSFEDGTATWSDEDLLTRATELGRVLFTQDDDLLEIAARWRAANRDFTGIVYAHQNDIDVGTAVRDLELLAKVYGREDLQNTVEYLPYS